MDNFRIDITAEGRVSLAKALALCFAHNAPGGKATHFIEARLALSKGPIPRMEPSDDGVPTLILLWNDEKHGDRCKPLPFPLLPDFAPDYVDQWLAHQDMGRQPDHDGYNGRGWRVFTESWGHVWGCQYAIAAIQPAWAMYGK